MYTLCQAQAGHKHSTKMSLFVTVQSIMENTEDDYIHRTALQVLQHGYTGSLWDRTRADSFCMAEKQCWAWRDAYLGIRRGRQHGVGGNAHKENKNTLVLSYALPPSAIIRGIGISNNHIVETSRGLRLNLEWYTCPQYSSWGIVSFLHQSSKLRRYLSAPALSWRWSFGRRAE